MEQDIEKTLEDPLYDYIKGQIEGIATRALPTSIWFGDHRQIINFSLYLKYKEPTMLKYKIVSYHLSYLQVPDPSHVTKGYITLLTSWSFCQPLYNKISQLDRTTIFVEYKHLFNILNNQHRTINTLFKTLSQHNNLITVDKDKYIITKIDAHTPIVSTSVVHLIMLLRAMCGISVSWPLLTIDSPTLMKELGERVETFNNIYQYFDNHYDGEHILSNLAAKASALRSPYVTPEYYEDADPSHVGGPRHRVSTVSHLIYYLDRYVVSFYKGFREIQTISMDDNGSSWPIPDLLIFKYGSVYIKIEDTNNFISSYLDSLDDEVLKCSRSAIINFFKIYKGKVSRIDLEEVVKVLGLDEDKSESHHNPPPYPSANYNSHTYSIVSPSTSPPDHLYIVYSPVYCYENDTLGRKECWINYSRSTEHVYQPIVDIPSTPSFIYHIPVTSTELKSLFFPEESKYGKISHYSVVTDEGLMECNKELDDKRNNGRVYRCNTRFFSVVNEGIHILSEGSLLYLDSQLKNKIKEYNPGADTLDIYTTVVALIRRPTILPKMPRLLLTLLERYRQYIGEFSFSLSKERISSAAVYHIFISTIYKTPIKTFIKNEEMEGIYNQYSFAEIMETIKEQAIGHIKSLGVE